jgi:hypothetical protein
MSHPIRKASIHTFQRVDSDGKGCEWIARFHPYKTYPILFSGKTRQEAVDAAETLRAEAIDKHEAQCIHRQKLRKLAAERKSAKERKEVSQ